MPGDQAPKDGWKIERDSLSKAIVYFRDGNVRTFWSFDWTYQFARRYRTVGLIGLRTRIVTRFGFTSHVILIIDSLSNEVIEKYIRGIRIPIPSNEPEPSTALERSTTNTMKQVQSLYDQLNPVMEPDKEGSTAELAVPFDQLYPNLSMDDGKVHVLFISPCLNGTGYYRMIAPYFELNKTDTHSAVISNLHKWSFNNGFEDYDHAHDERLWQWAHYVVFPAIFVSLADSLDQALHINPRLKFVMDIDCLYHAMPEQHPAFRKLDAERLQTLIANLLLMDVVTTPTNELMDWYMAYLNQHHATTGGLFASYPNLLSSVGYEDIVSIKQSKTNVVRIGIIGNPATYFDTLGIVGLLKQIKKEYGNGVELILFGWNGKIGKSDHQLEGLEFTQVKSVAFTHYLGKLNSLRLDMALLPMLDIPYNTEGKSFVKYLELAAFQIPVVASLFSPYSDIIEDGFNGLLAEDRADWYDHTRRMIENKLFRYKLGKEAFKTVWSRYCYTSDSIQILKEILR